MNRTFSHRFRNGRIRIAVIGAGALVLAHAMISPVPAAAEELIVYGATPADEWQVYKQAFEAENPDITLNQFQDTSGALIARLIAERDAPLADVLFDMPATAIVVLEREGLIEPYAPAGLADLDPRLVDDSDPPSWFAYSGFAALACYNRLEGEAKGIPAPQSWQDLTDPVYRGQITMADPNSSGVGMMLVSGFLQMLGEEEGWKFLDALHENIAFYTLGGRKPCVLTGAGEYVLGLSLETAATREIKNGAPIDAIIPDEGMFWDVASVALVQSTDNPEAARRFLDWASSRAANSLYADFWSIVAIRDLAKPQPHLPANFLDELRPIDLDWLADNRERIGAEWQRRYATKVEQE